RIVRPLCRAPSLAPSANPPAPSASLKERHGTSPTLPSCRTEPSSQSRLPPKNAIVCTRLPCHGHTLASDAIHTRAWSRQFTPVQGASVVHGSLPATDEGLPKRSRRSF